MNVTRPVHFFLHLFHNSLLNSDPMLIYETFVSKILTLGNKNKSILFCIPLAKSYFCNGLVAKLPKIRNEGD